MKAIRLVLALLLICPAVSAQLPDPDSAEATVKWLRSLVIEGRVGLQPENGGKIPRLFSEELDDGRTWMQYIVDDIGVKAGGDPNDPAAPDNWPLLDEAVGICLAEAKRLKAQAESSAGMPAEATYNQVRKHYLEGAANLLGFYKQAANDSFLANAGDLVGVPALPDWAVPLLNPGEIQIREIAGAGRLNVETLDFSGRASGLIQIPGLQTTLAVPNFSFDTMGNVDLTAYGQTNLPPGDPDGVTLTIPPKRPLDFHLGSGGDWSVAGSLQIELANGNLFEGYFDVDDPEYEFGLSFTGSETLVLAKEMGANLPDLDSAATFPLPEIEGFAKFFGAFGRGMETLKGESAETPSAESLSIGAAPDFKEPDSPVPFDVVETWLVSLENDAIRPKLGSFASDTLVEVSEFLASMNSDIKAARRGAAPTLNEIRRLRRLAEANAKVATILKRAQDQNHLENNSEADRLLMEASEGALEAEDISKEYLNNLPNTASFKVGLAAVRLWLDANQTAATLGGPGLDVPFLDSLRPKFDLWETNALLSFGITNTGQILNQAKVDSLRPDDLRMLLRFAIEVHSLRTQLTTGGDPPALPSNLMIFLASEEFSKTKASYDKAIASNDEAGRALAAVRLTDLGVISGSIDILVSNQNRTAMAEAIHETHGAIAGANPGPERSELAWKVLDAARRDFEQTHKATRRRTMELLGQTATSSPFSTRTEFSFLEKPFLTRWYLALRAVGNEGVIDAARKGELELTIASFMKFFAKAQTTRFTDATLIEQNMEDSWTALLILSDGIAIVEDMLPSDTTLHNELRQEWETLHDLWRPVAADKNQHRFLSKYARELAAASTRYGDGLGTPLQTPFIAKGSELVHSLNTVAENLRDLVDQVGSDTFDFALPGDLQVQRLYGDLAFNRETLEWSLAFGGRLRFPEIDAVFEIPAATLMSDGAFSLSLLAESDTSFGLNEDFAVAFAIPAEDPPHNIPFTGVIPLPSNGFTPQLNGFSAMGELIYHKGQPDELSLEVAIGYEALDPGHKFSVGFAAEDTNLELFTPEIMFFDGGIGFDLVTSLNGSPTQGGAEADVKLGFLLRPGAESDPALRDEMDYYLIFNGGAQIDFSTTDQTIQFTLKEGAELLLPPDIFTGPDLNGDNVPDPPKIVLQSAICAQLDFNDPSFISWCDIEGNPVRLAFENIGFKIPGLADSEVKEVKSSPEIPDPDNPGQMLDPESEIPGFTAGLSAVLLFDGLDFPVIEKIDARVEFPMPGIEGPKPPEPNLVVLDIRGRDWRLDGLPGEISLTLGETLRIMNLDGFSVDLIGADDDAANATGLAFIGDPEDGPPTLRFTAGILCAIEETVVSKAPETPPPPGNNLDEKVSFTAVGSLAWEVGDPVPTLTIPELRASGKFNLGGPNGITIKGASSLGQSDAEIILLNPLNVFQRSAQKPFEIRLTGALDIANFIEFGLEQTSIIWDDQDLVTNPDGTTMLVPRVPSANLVPRFSVGGFYGALGKESIDLAGEYLPFYPTLIGLRFNDPNLPLVPLQGQLGLLDPGNVRALLSGVVNLPNGSAVDAGSPGLFGRVDTLQIGFIRDPQSQLYVPDLAALDLNGFCLQIQNFDCPPIGGLSGGLCIGNLNALPDNPQDLYLAGTLGGKMKDIGASVLFAAKPTEFIGACFELTAGPAGIPLDGGMLGGILLTGGRGGFNFKNKFSNPCDFRAYVDAGARVPERDEMPPEGFPPRDQNPIEPETELIPPDWTGGLISCLEAPFPPESINPLCEVFPPDSGRVVFKGTRVEATPQGAVILANLGITPDSVNDEPIDQVVQLVVNGFLDPVNEELQDAVLAATDNGAPLEAVEFFMDLADNLRDSFDDAATSILTQAIRTGLDVPEGQPVPSVYDLIVQQAALGIPCFDVTCLIGGTISHSTISQVLSGSGDITISTTGTASFEGRINLIGIPVATGTLAISLTNDEGDIDPAFGGRAKVAVGPLDLAELSAAISCQGCFTTTASEFANLLACQGAALGPGATEFAYQMMETVFTGESIDRGITLADHFASFDTQKQLAYMSSFFNYFQLLVNGDPLPAKSYAPDGTPIPLTIEATDFDNFRQCFADFVVALFPQVNPFICFSGAVKPKLFGFPLTGGAETFLGASLVYGRVEDNGEQFQELTAACEFSPTFMMLAPILQSSAASFPSFDQASMGYSLRIPAFTRETTELLLTDPVQFAQDQVNSLYNDAVLSFSYEISPFGMDMASGQGRMVLPALESHPMNLSRTLPVPFGIDPADWDPAARWGGLRHGSELDAFIESERTAGRAVKLPTRTELILAALSKGHLKNPRWRGTQADLATLFSSPGIPADPMEDPADAFTVGYSPSTASCDELTAMVGADLNAADPGYAELAMRSFTNDFFAHGGLIGGAELDFPNVLANEMPLKQLAELFALPATATQFTDDWLPNAKHLFGMEELIGEPGFGYFTGTNCVGQMAFYLPAPAPLVPDPDNLGEFTVIDFDNADLAGMISSLQALDFNSIVQGADAFYPEEEVLLSGWLDAPILGMPVAQGSMKYDNNSKIFDLHAAVEENTWLADWVGASIDFQVQPPEYQLTNLSPDGAAEKLAEIGSALTGAAFGDTQNLIGQVASTMPKVSASAAMNLTLPAEAGAYLNTAAATNLEMFAFSPAFDPDYLPADNSPYAAARRRGGLGIRGDFQLGYFPPTGEPIVIDIEEASFAVLPSNLPGSLPALAGTIRINELTPFHPDLPSFTDGELSFATEPANGAPYLTLAGHLEPFKFVLPGNIDYLTFDPLIPGGTIGGTLNIVRDDAIPGTKTGLSLEVDPVSATMPFLGPQIAISIYGEEVPENSGNFSAFTFATTADEAWGPATVCLSALNDPSAPPTFQICDPFNPGGPCLLEFTPNAPVCGTISGTGLSSFQMELQIPAGFDATFFSGTDAEVTQTIGGTDPYTLHIDSNGRFFIDLGLNSDFGLPGALTSTGVIEFGYNPDGNNPNVRPVSNNLAFGSIDLADTKGLGLTIRNQGAADANIILNTKPRDEFLASVSGFNLAPGQERIVDIVFTPQATGQRNGTLEIESNDPRSPFTVPLSASVTSSPRYFQSRDSIDFGPTLINGTSKASLTIGNDGSAPLNLTGISVPNANYAISPAGPQAIPPGESLNYIVSFTPSGTLGSSGDVTVTTATQGSHTIAVSGTGSESRWVTLLTSEIADSKATLNDILMFDDGRRGFVVGDSGTVLETDDAGRSWIPRDITSYDMKALAMRRMINEEVIAEYHFEEPPGSQFFRDESANAYHGTPPTAGESPQIHHSHGQIGSGLSFDGNNDSVDLAAFNLPTSWSIALWVNPTTTNNFQVFVAKNSGSGGNQFIFGFYEGGYHLSFGGQTHTAGTKQTGWQHLVLTGEFDEDSKTTTVRLYRDGAEIWARPSFVGAVPPFGGGMPWSIGQEWDGGPSRSDFFGGEIDELYFFDGALSAEEIGYLSSAYDAASQRLVMAGSNGMVFESLTKGRAWRQHFDQNVLGWRSRSLTYHDQDYHAVEITESGKILLAGSSDGNRLLLLEDHHPGRITNPANPEDDEFDDVTFDPGAGSGVGDPLFAIGENGDVYTASRFGLFFRANTPDSSYFRQGSADHDGAIRDLHAFSLNDFVAVGDNGGIYWALNNANPISLGSPDLVTEDLWAVTEDDDFHAVGDRGTYLLSSNGQNWNLQVDGLTGDMRGVAAVQNGFNDDVWAVGKNHSIQFRPTNAPNGPFLTFFPGELDFDFLLRGKSRTLPLTLTNSGNRDLVLSQIAVDGTRFRIKQTSLDPIPPGDTITLFVRYDPGPFDFGPQFSEITITTNEPASNIHRVSLKGRAGSRNWQPVNLGGEGKVIDLAFTSSTVGYALVDRGVGLDSQIYKTTDGGENWGNPIVLPTFGGNVLRLSALDFSPASQTLGLACGRIETASGAFLQGVLLRTINAGDSWPRITGTLANVEGRAFADVELSDDDVLFAVMSTSSTTGNGDVWRSSSAGTTWVNDTNRPASFFDGGVVAHIANSGGSNDFSIVMATSGSRLYQRFWNVNWGQDIPKEAFEQSQVIRDLSFYDLPGGFLPDHGWIVGDQGLFWRWDSGGPAGPDYYPAANAEVFGTTNLARVNFHDESDGWVAGESRIFDSSDGGRSWDLNYDAGPSAELCALDSISDTSAWVGGSLDSQALVWRYRGATAPDTPLLTADDLVVLDPAAPGGSSVKEVSIQNAGSVQLSMHQLTIESDDPVQRWTITNSPSTIPAGATRVVTVQFDALPETLDLQALDPEVFLRFEDDLTATTYLDCSLHQRNGNAAAADDNRPEIRSPRGKRDRGLSFDGNDHAEISQPDDLGDDFTVAFWVNPESTGNNQFFLGKHTSGGDNLFLVGFHEGGHYVAIRGDKHIGMDHPRRTGWQHVVITGRRTGSDTLVTWWRDGEILWSEPLAAVLGNISGAPWILGAERDPTQIDQHMTGSLDDVALFDRHLTEGEIQALANKSPVAGMHEATLVIDSDSEDGRYVVDLRAEVLPTSRMVTFQTNPPGMQLIIDGVKHLAPVSFGVGPVGGQRTWCEGSLHTVVASQSAAVKVDGSDLTYGFTGWNVARGDTLTVTASTAASEYTANYAVTRVVDGNRRPPPDLPPPPGGPQFNISQALAGSPLGPFLRLRNAALTVPALGTNAFTVEGELLLSPSKMAASLSTTALDFPATGSPKWLELGASNWLLDWEDDKKFILKTHPPSFGFLGIDVAPDGQFCIELEEDVNRYRAVFALNQPYEILPHFFEIKPGNHVLQYNGGTSFELEFAGGFRAIDLPFFTGAPNWAVETNVGPVFSSPDINESLERMLTGSGVAVPAALFDLGIFKLGWGDVRIANNPGWQLQVNDLEFSIFGQPVAMVEGAVGLDGGLVLDGTLPANAEIPLVNGSAFSLRESAGGGAAFHLTMDAFPEPRIQVTLPGMSLRSTADSFPAAGLNLPGITFDTSGSFDTGKLPLPAFHFDGILLAPPEDAGLTKNYIQLRKDSSGDIFFDVRAQITPIPLCDLHDLSFTIENTTVSGSINGNFCVFPEPIPIGFNSDSNCQFQGGDEDFMIFFGTSCGGYQNLATGLCFWDCTP